jgi:tetratricopeptide (TPR) repeat protein
LALERYPEAQRDYEKAIQLNANEAYYHLGLANFHFTLDQHTQAVVAYDKVLQLKPDLVDAVFNRALVYMIMGNAEKGCPEMKRARELGHDSAQEVYRKYCR